VNPLVSILILTYNQEAFIAQAIESVLAQQVNFDIEILIGNDCSTDQTKDIIYKYESARKGLLRACHHPVNIGALKNEKFLFDKARGKYICFLEGDDFWTDNQKLQKQIDFLEANFDYGMTHSDVDHFYELTGITEHHVNRKNNNKMPEGFIFNNLMEPNPIFIKTATVCFRKELVTQYFDYDLAIKDNWPLTDFPLWLDISFHSKVHYMDEVFATYRLLNESASRTQLPEKKLRFHNGLHHIKQTYIARYKVSDTIKFALEDNYYKGLLKIAYNLSDGPLAQKAITYLKGRGLKINLNEKLLVLGAHYKPVKNILNFVRNKT
jgi:glycosyltransferase involved in cell wall biosynthesis